MLPISKKIPISQNRHYWTDDELQFQLETSIALPKRLQKLGVVMPGRFELPSGQKARAWFLDDLLRICLAKELSESTGFNAMVGAELVYRLGTPLLNDLFGFSFFDSKLVLSREYSKPEILNVFPQHLVAPRKPQFQPNHEVKLLVSDRKRFFLEASGNQEYRGRTNSYGIWFLGDGVDLKSSKPRIIDEEFAENSNWSELDSPPHSEKSDLCVHVGKICSALSDAFLAEKDR